METSILYFVAIYLPTVVILFSFGNIVFSIGEFKKNLNKIPRILVMMLSKYISITSILLHIYHYVFTEYLVYGMEATLMVAGNYMVFEMLSSNKLITHYTKFSECVLPENLNTRQEQQRKLSHFDSFVKKVTSKIFSCNKLLYIWTTLSAMIFGIFILIELATNFSVFSTTLIILFIITMYVKLIIFKYLNADRIIK